MRLIKPKVEILDQLNEESVITKIAAVSRTCYKSEGLSTPEKDKALVKRLIDSKHDAMLEFVDVTVKFTTDTGISHELVRHRMASYAQESSRYCNYSKDKFSNELTYIIPSWLDIPEGNYSQWDGDWVNMDKMKINLPHDNEKAVCNWLHTLRDAELTYRLLTNKGWTAEQARSVLPKSIKTEINMKANLREWRHFFRLRCSKHAHPDMRVLALDLLKQMHDKLPTIFEDIYQEFYGTERQDD